MTVWQYRRLVWDRQGPITYQVQKWLLQDVTPEGLVTIKENSFVPTQDHMRTHIHDALAKVEDGEYEGVEWFAKKALDNAVGNIGQEVYGMIASLGTEGWELYSEVESKYGEDGNDPALKGIMTEYKFKRESAGGQLLDNPNLPKSSEKQQSEGLTPPKKDVAVLIKRYVASADVPRSLVFSGYTFQAGVAIDFPDLAWLAGDRPSSNDPEIVKLFEWPYPEEAVIKEYFHMDDSYIGLLKKGLFRVYCPECNERYSSSSVHKDGYYIDPLAEGSWLRFSCDQGHELWKEQDMILTA